MADRGFSGTMETALASSEVALAFLCYLDWQGGAVRLWSGAKSITYGGNTYTGVGTLGSIDQITDSLDKADIGVRLRLNYLDDTLRNEIVTNSSVGRAASLFLALINVAAGTVTDAYEIFTGFIDECEIEDAGDTGALNIRLASELAKLRRPKYFQLSNAHQQYLFSGDFGMEFAPHMAETIIWGRYATPVTGGWGARMTGGTPEPTGGRTATPEPTPDPTIPPTPHHGNLG